ncbi:tRNA lysidine(34) synthetase TilS [Candidatus Saccharibacteria bacterium]|nr:tRNA lysidine(34) synthetase TilS [Candidatus Saccharibacteria bacterium]
MRKVLAVSGGVDSMAMLDLMRKNFPSEELVVATFDHGTRESSKLDADFVADACAKYHLQICKGEAKLGANVSEEEARNKRYEFLRKVARDADGEIYTAHHLDDLVESVVINLARGTGFRGLAVLNAPGVKRPFLDRTFGKVFDKRDILKYAGENNVMFRQDPTNTNDDYLRNRLRPAVLDLSRATKNEVYELWQKQTRLTQEIDGIIDDLIPEDLVFKRAWFKDLDDDVAIEILRAGLIKAGIPATRPQIRDFLKAVREYATNKRFNLPNDKLVRMGRRDFTLKI